MNSAALGVNIYNQNKFTTEYNMEIKYKIRNENITVRIPACGDDRA